MTAEPLPLAVDKDVDMSKEGEGDKERNEGETGVEAVGAIPFERERWEREIREMAAKTGGKCVVPNSTGTCKTYSCFEVWSNYLLQKSKTCAQSHPSLAAERPAWPHIPLEWAVVEGPEGACPLVSVWVWEVRTSRRAWA